MGSKIDASLSLLSSPNRNNGGGGNMAKVFLNWPTFDFNFHHPMKKIPDKFFFKIFDKSAAAAVRRHVAKWKIVANF